eukprot:gene11643-34352_t
MVSPEFRTPQIFKFASSCSLTDIAFAFVAMLFLVPRFKSTCGATSAHVDEERLIGWKGESSESSPMWVEQISWAPRVAILHNFISDAEIDVVLNEALPTMTRSTVSSTKDAPPDAGNDCRTSFGTFLTRFQTLAVESIERRVADLVQIPVVYQEGMNVLRYGTEDGGEVAFPDTYTDEYQEGEDDCAKGHLHVKPKRGDAVLFWSATPGGKTEDPLSWHGSCPVTKGSKWAATIWVHASPVDAYDWNGTNFMSQGDPTLFDGICRASCGLCEEPSKPRDIDSYNRNRKSVGYLAYDPEEMTWLRDPWLRHEAQQEKAKEKEEEEEIDYYETSWFSWLW